MTTSLNDILLTAVAIVVLLAIGRCVYSWLTSDTDEYSGERSKER